MLSKTLSPTGITATVAITSFIIQQSLQILDPVINWGIKKLQPLFADTEAKDDVSDRTQRAPNSFFAQVYRVRTL